MGSLIDYWYYTGDTAYNQIASDGLLFQVGPYNDYMPPNQTLTEGNDDQGFWGMAVMSAAEYNFPNPSADKPQWLALAQAVFNTQAARWDPEDCNGGLRWQIFQWNSGYDYKNSISQGCFFNIAARLALYTGNTSYADWATKTWDWMNEIKFMDENYRIYDGSHIEDGCTSIVPYQFSYNAGSFMLGAAAMYALAEKTNNSADLEVWRERVDGLLNATEEVFFLTAGDDPPIMFEVACEGVGLCDLDQLSFKAYLSRWMAATTKWAPWTYDRIKPLLENSAKAAAHQCTGGNNGRMCGLKWANNSGAWDGTTGVGQQMAAMEVVLATMVQQAEAPVTNNTGGTSAGDPGGGGSDIGRTDPQGSIVFAPVTAGDRAGAIICTIIICASLLAAMVFMMSDETKTAGENWTTLRSSLSKNAEAAVLMKGGRDQAFNEKGKGLPRDASSSHGADARPPLPVFVQATPPRARVRRASRPERYAPQRSVTPPAAMGADTVADGERGVSFDTPGQKRSLRKKTRTLSA